MTSQIVLEQTGFGKCTDLLHLPFQQPCIPRGNGVPGGAHSGNVIEHIALRFFHSAKVGCHLLGFHDYLTQQQDTGTDDLDSQMHHANQRVYLGQVPTVGAQLLPDVGHSIQPDHIHTLISKEKHVFHHIVEHHWVGIV